MATRTRTRPSRSVSQRKKKRGAVNKARAKHLRGAAAAAAAGAAAARRGAESVPPASPALDVAAEAEAADAGTLDFDFDDLERDPVLAAERAAAATEAAAAAAGRGDDAGGAGEGGVRAAAMTNVVPSLVAASGGPAAAPEVAAVPVASAATMPTTVGEEEAARAGGARMEEDAPMDLAPARAPSPGAATVMDMEADEPPSEEEPPAMIPQGNLSITHNAAPQHWNQEPGDDKFINLAGTYTPAAEAGGGAESAVSVSLLVKGVPAAHGKLELRKATLVPVVGDSAACGVYEWSATARVVDLAAAYNVGHPAHFALKVSVLGGRGGEVVLGSVTTSQFSVWTKKNTRRPDAVPWSPERRAKFNAANFAR
jgi:hypothetical protein